MFKKYGMLSVLGGYSAICALFAVFALQVNAAESDDENQAEDIEEVIVTGSRIKRSNVSSASPLTVISGQSLLDSGFSNLGEALRQQTSVGTGGFNQSSILSGGGATSIDLRNLGPDRVLILINGRRVASFADALANQAADLTFVPTAMVERVEILRDGASAVYGSDAVTGVINVILKNDFEGANLKVNAGISGEGDGESQGLALTLGASGDKGNLVFGLEIRDQDDIKQIDRDWSFPNIVTLGATTIQHGSFFSPGGVFFGTTGIYCTQPKAFGGDEVTDVSATTGCPSFLSPSNRDEVVRYDYGLEQDLLNSSQIISASSYGTYELTDESTVYGEMQFSNRQTVSNLDGNPGSFGTPAFPDGSFVPGTNPNNSLGDGFFYFRPSSTIGTRHQTYDSDTFRLVIGVEGSIPEEMWFNNDWSYDFSYLYTKVSARFVTDAVWNLARFIRISDPAQCALDSLCASVVNPSGALDSYRPGNWTQAEIDYMRQISSASSEFTTHGYNASISGPLAELPAGSLTMAFGIEKRREAGLNKPDSITEAGESVANQTFTTEGGFDLDEFFFEFNVPLVSDVTAFEMLELNLQYRQSDYSNFGTEDVYRVGLNWQIWSDLRIRANTSTAYRAPTVTDLFGGGTASFDFVDDPCENPAAGSNTFQNCVLDGIADPATFTQPGGGQIQVLAGSNPNLQPETADTYTVGFVYTPEWAPGLSITADVWDIEVESLISRPTSTSILEACYSGAVGLTDPACGQFDGRNFAGVPRSFINQLTNITDSVLTDGVDLGINYTFDAFGSTQWDISLVATYIDENSFYPEAGGADDRGSIPRVNANLSTNVTYGNWNFGWIMRYISATDDPRYDGNNVFGYDGADAYDKHDLRVSYNWDSYRILVGVNNVLDEDPPYVFSTGNNTDTFLYDVIGTYWFARFNMDI